MQPHIQAALKDLERVTIDILKTDHSKMKSLDWIKSCCQSRYALLLKQAVIASLTAQHAQLLECMLYTQQKMMLMFRCGVLAKDYSSAPSKAKIACVLEQSKRQNDWMMWPSFQPWLIGVVLMLSLIGPILTFLLDRLSGSFLPEMPIQSNTAKKKLAWFHLHPRNLEAMARWHPANHDTRMIRKSINI